MLELGGDVHTVNAKGETAAHGAATLGANPIVRMLAERGACLDAINDAGHTPLAIAEGIPQLVFRQQVETAALLRRLLAARAVAVKNGRTPASSDGQPSCGGMEPGNATPNPSRLSGQESDP